MSSYEIRSDNMMCDLEFAVEDDCRFAIARTLVKFNRRQRLSLPKWGLLLVLSAITSDEGLQG